MNFVAVLEKQFLGFAFLYVIFSFEGPHCQHSVALGKPLGAGEGHDVRSRGHKIVGRDLPNCAGLVIIFPLGGDARADKRGGSSFSRTELLHFFGLEIVGVGKLQSSNKLNFAHNFNSLFSIHNKLITFYKDIFISFSIFLQFHKTSQNVTIPEPAVAPSTGDRTSGVP